MHMNMHSQPAYYAWRDVEHGDECGCMLLAQAIGVPADTVVLQAGASEALALALQPRRLPGRRAPHAATSESRTARSRACRAAR
jgi:hypothetical protein